MPESEKNNVGDLIDITGVGRPDFTLGGPKRTEATGLDLSIRKRWPWYLAAVVSALIVLGSIVGPGSGPNVGDEVRIGRAGMASAWMASSEDDLEDLLEAENLAARGGKNSGVLLRRMSDAGRARAYAAGTRAVIVKRASTFRQVEITEGEDRGRDGWIQAELLQSVR